MNSKTIAKSRRKPAATSAPMLSTQPVETFCAVAKPDLDGVIAQFVANGWAYSVHSVLKLENPYRFLQKPKKAQAGAAKPELSETAIGIANWLRDTDPDRYKFAVGQAVIDARRNPGATVLVVCKGGKHRSQATCYSAAEQFNGLRETDAEWRRCAKATWTALSAPRLPATLPARD